MAGPTHSFRRRHGIDPLKDGPRVTGGLERHPERTSSAQCAVGDAEASTGWSMARSAAQARQRREGEQWKKHSTAL